MPFSCFFSGFLLFYLAREAREAGLFCVCRERLLQWPFSWVMKNFSLPIAFAYWLFALLLHL
jgi:hypothetical protein